MSLKHDYTVDRLRGLAIFWVIWVHVLYAGFFFRDTCLNVWQSLCLFEMPLFFFVTGATASLSDKKENYFLYVYKKWKRILIPYWFYSCICIIIALVLVIIHNDFDFAYMIKIILSWLVPCDKQISVLPYITWALWYIPVYLCVVIFMPILKLVQSSRFKLLLFPVLIALFILTNIFEINILKNVSFYLIWVYVGLFYKDMKPYLINTKKTLWKVLFIMIGIVGMAMSYIANPHIIIFDMQVNKFPPNIMFLSFSIVALGLICLLLPKYNAILEKIESDEDSKKILNIFYNNSLTIFLYQSFAFMAAIPLVNSFLPWDGLFAAFIKAFLCLILALIFSILLACIFRKIETIGQKKR